MTTHRRVAGGLTALAAGAALAVLGALPASAAAAVSVSRSDGSPVGSGQTVTADDTLAVRGQIDPRTATTDLVVLAPGDATGHVVDEGSGSLTRGDTLTYSLDTACYTADPGAPCSGRAPAPNGTWTVQLRGGASASLQFVLRIAPAAPTGVSALADGQGAVVTWQRGAEPDLVSYDVLDGSGRLLAGGLPVDQVCSSDGRCSSRVPDAGDGTIAVRAQRATCPSCSDTVASAASSPARVETPSQVGSPSSVDGSASGGGQPTAGGGSTSGGSTAGSAGTGGSGSSTGGGTTASHTRTTRAATGANLQQLLAPPNAAAPPTVPASVLAPLADGTYQPKLAYGEQTVGQNVLVPDGSAPELAGDGSDSGLAALVDGSRLWQSVAEGLLLLLVCAHCVAWLIHTKPE